MADVQDIIVRYQSEVDQAVADLNKLAEAQDEIVKGEKDQEKQAQKTEVSQREASKLRISNLKKEEQELRKLEAAKKKAFTVGDISAYNSKIAETQKRISVLKNETSSFASSAKNIFAGVAGGLAAAFSAQAVINFTQQSVQAFLEAEKNAQRLKFAITTIGGESELQFERLIKQSAELQKITVFSDDSIQQAQAALAAFGLTADEIENLIPKLADFATITSQDIPSAAQQIGAALEGNGREFKKYGIEVSATASRTENLSSVMEGLTKFQGAAADATQTLTGQLEQQKNQVDELQESIGEKLAPGWVRVKKAFLEYIDAIITSKDELTLDSIARDQKSNADKTIEVLQATAKDIQKIYNIPFNEAYLKALEQQIAAEEKAQESAAKSNLARSVREYNNASQALDILNKELEDFNNKLIADAAAQEALNARVLTSAQIRSKSVEDLIKLSEKEKEIGDDVAKNNIKNIDAEIKAREKAAEEYKKNLKKLADLQIENIDDEKQRRIAAFEQEKKDLTSSGKLRADTIVELEKKLVKDLNEIDLKRNVDPLFRAPETKPTQNVVLNPEMQTEVNSLIALGKTEAEAIAEVLENVRKKASDPAEGIAKTWLDANERILTSSLQLFGELTSLYDNFANARVDQITRQKEADISAIDEQIEANKEALENRQITNRTEEELNKNLTNQKIEAEKKADKEIRKIRRQQAIIDKANALFQIALNTAIALSNASNLATFGALSPLIIALGAAQAAAVVAQPIPAFAKGTKGKQGSGLARVGEQGEETVFLPHGAKVLPNKQTKMYAGLMDSMFDMNADKYIYRHFVAPALMAQKREYDSKGRSGGSFAENVANATKLPPPTSTKINIPSSYTMSNTDELADKIASRLTTNRRRL
jgi:hypothetical protein